MRGAIFFVLSCPKLPLFFGMTIWLIALLIMASVAALGYRQGAVRVAVSFIGIIVGALLAPLVGKWAKPALMAFSVKNPVVLWLLGPPIFFVIISAIFKTLGLMAHQKVDVHFRYKAGELKQALWERLNSRVGFCLGLFNGAAYVVLISFVVYMLGYWTVPLSGSDTDPKWMKITTRLAKDLEASGFAKVARAVDRMPKSWYDAADLAALLYRNPLVDARLAGYPAFFSLAERQQFQDLGKDQEFLGLRTRTAPIMEQLDEARVQAIVNDPEMLKTIWETLLPNMKDFRTYLQTGRSEKYDPINILGHWKFNVNVAMATMRKGKASISAREMQRLKHDMTVAFSKTTFMAMPDPAGASDQGPAVLRNVPPKPLVQGGPSVGGQNVQCQWSKGDAGKYSLSVSGSDAPATVEGDRLTMGGPGLEMVFDRGD
ncbi:MAG: hypothetical protein C5B50_05815 [Verrucomicrobia bacterium]|nr:MAG: hypothetical protein C5B50_05815 [Verrucomicrobiota bacterium]